MLLAEFRVVAVGGYGELAEVAVLDVLGDTLDSKDFLGI